MKAANIAQAVAYTRSTSNDENTTALCNALNAVANFHKGKLEGYRFTDGSAVTNNFVEFLGTFQAECPAPPETRAVEELPRGEFVKRTADANKVYQRGEYDRSTGKYSLIDCEDVNREVWVKRGTQLHVGFTY